MLFIQGSCGTGLTLGGGLIHWTLSETAAGLDKVRRPRGAFLFYVQYSHFQVWPAEGVYFCTHLIEHLSYFTHGDGDKAAQAWKWPSEKPNNLRKNINHGAIFDVCENAKLSSKCHYCCLYCHASWEIWGVKAGYYQLLELFGWWWIFKRLDGECLTQSVLCNSPYTVVFDDICLWLMEKCYNHTDWCYYRYFYIYAN